MGEMERIQYIVDRMESIDHKTSEILVQTTKTNGRVTALEKEFERSAKEVAELSKSSSFNKGRDRVLYILIGAVGAVIAIIFEHLLNK